MRNISIAVAAALLLVCSGCGAPGDGEIRSQIESALRSDASTANVTVSVSERVVVLSGEVPDEAARLRAGRFARVRGVKEVRNELKIITAPPGERADDDAIRQKIESALREKDCGQIGVSVKDGTATLSGDIDRLKVGECVMAAQVISKKVENKLRFKE